MSNILEQANNIINNRSEEKERQYGPIGEGFERAAMIASGMSGKEWSAHDMFIAMVALKFSRQSYNFKEDNLLDACSYIGAWQNYINESENEIESETNETEDSFGLEFENTLPTPDKVTGYTSRGELVADSIATSPYDSDRGPFDTMNILNKIKTMGENQ